MESSARLSDFGREDDKVNYQHFEHDPLTLVQFLVDRTSPNLPPIGKQFKAKVRVYCPDIRVVSRLACVFEPQDPNDFANYELSSIYNDVVSVKCIKARDRIARVGEIIGKNGVPYQFPKSVEMDGIAFQNNDDCPYIDTTLNLGFPGVPGTWSFFYHATSDNKLKKTEWEQYISKVNMVGLQTAGIYRYALPS